MGQARNRGTYEERKAAAVARREAEDWTCPHCGVKEPERDHLFNGCTSKRIVPPGSAVLFALAAAGWLDRPKRKRR